MPEEVETIPVELNQEVADSNLQDDDQDREPTTSPPEIVARSVPIEDP